MLPYLARRIALALVTLFTVSVLTFWLFFAVPTDPAALQCGKQCNEAQLQQIRESLGLGRPTYQLYLEYMGGIFTGRTIGKGDFARACPAPCLGYSFRTGEPVLDMIERALPVSFSIVAGAAFLWVFGGVALGVLSALRRGSWIDKTAIGFSLAGSSMPIYFVGLMFQLLVVFKLHWFPVPSYTSPLQSPWQWATGLVLAWVTLALLFVALYTRLTRAQLLETLSEDFIRTARAKGLPMRTVQLRHALRAAITPIVTIAGIDIGSALSSTIITENVFGLQGLGRLAAQAAVELNLPIVMATVLIAAFFIITANVIVDVLYAVIDPRVRLGVTSPAEEAPLLEVEDLSVDFPTTDGVVRAVDGLSFSVRRGQTLGIVGESGSGKTVANLAIMGLHDRRRARISGRILLGGDDVIPMSEEQVRLLRGRRMAMIFQDPLTALHPYYTIGRQIAEAYRVHNAVSKAAARARAIELLGRVGIPQPDKRVDDYPHELSGGMRQRAMIAMALSCNPELLIADEPTTALDVTVQAQILDLMLDLQREFHSAIILITHDLGVVARVADDVLVMYAGRAAERGTAEQVLRHPQHPYTWGLLRSVPSLHGDVGTDLVPIVGNPPSLIDVPSGCPFHPRCPFAGRNGNRSFTEVPLLTPVSGEPGHLVACHLPEAERRAIFEREVAGIGAAL